MLARLVLLSLLAAAPLAAAAESPAPPPEAAPSVSPPTPPEPEKLLKPWNRGIVYGRAMLTIPERREYWAGLNALTSDAEKRAYWEAHIERMQQLAIERGVEIEAPPNAPRRPLDTRKFSHVPYFREMMTTAEQDAYRDAVWHIHDDQERWKFVASHILRMRKRALDRGVTYPGLSPYEKNAVELSGMEVDPDPSRRAFFDEAELEVAEHFEPELPDPEPEEADVADAADDGSGAGEGRGAAAQP